jgi:carbon starvation protein CstA
VLTQPGNLPEIDEAFTSHHPANLPIFPMLFITIACGAVSGFHATQSPMMARCLKNEKLGRPVFYGAMITEGLVALIWAAAAMKFADMLNTEGATPYEKLAAFLKANNGNVAAVVNAICNDWLGTIGALLAVLGVVAAPITSGDTAFRSARLIIAEWLHFEQKSMLRRLIISVPLFVASLLLIIWQMKNPDGFNVLWQYFGWFNQNLSVFTLWMITVYLARYHKKAYIITLVPAVFMTVVCTTFIIASPQVLGRHDLTGVTVVTVTVVAVAWFFLWLRRERAASNKPLERD